MSELCALVSLELRSLYGINQARYTKDDKTKKRYRILAVAWVILIGMACVYVGALTYGLCTLGLSSVVPAYLTVIASLIILFFRLFTAGARIFGARGYDLLAAMPLRSSAMVCSRFAALYLADLGVAAVMFLPGMAVYGYLLQPPAWFYVSAVAGLFFIPVIPIVISVLLGTLVLGITSRMKSKSLAQSVLMVLLVLVMMLGSFGMEDLAANMSSAQFAQLASTVGEVLERVYPPATWFAATVLQQHVWGIFLFAGVSLAALAAVLWLATVNFHAIVRRLYTVAACHNYRISTLQSRGLLKTLYFREIKRYFSSAIYVTNTIVGPVLGAVMAVALCVGGTESVTAEFPFPIDVTGLLPFVFAAVTCMMSTTSVSISLEGNRFWIVKALPVPTKIWLDAKILMYLTLQLPFYAIAEVLFAIALRPSVAELVWLLVIPAVTVIFSAVFGVAVNLRFHSFDWTQEAVVVKQSLPAALGSFTPTLVCLLLGGAVLVTPAPYAVFVKAGACVLLLAVTALLYRSNNQKRMELL